MIDFGRWFRGGGEKHADRRGAVLDNNYGLVNTGRIDGGVYVTAAGEQRTFASLTLPWRAPDKETSLFSLLSWQSGLTPLIGRQRELGILEEWASAGGPGIQAKILSGEGGMGKTRLAVALAERLREAGWAAGFVDLAEPRAYSTAEAGTLLIVDYPEERRPQVRELLRALAGQEADRPVRLLLLSRQGAELWQPEIDACGADPLFKRPLELAGLAALEPYGLFSGARERVAELHGLGVLPEVSEEAFAAWLARDELHRRPLFVLAAAIHDAWNPGALDYGGAAIVSELVRRERRRLRNESDAAGLGPYALERLSALAAMAGGLDGTAMERLCDPALGLGVPEVADLADRLHRTGRLDGGRLPAPSPDLVAARLVEEVLEPRRDWAPEWIWRCVGPDPGIVVDRIGRLTHDARVVLGRSSSVLEASLAEAVTGNHERCERLRAAVGDAVLPLGVVRTGIAVYRTLLEGACAEDDRAGLLNNLSIRLADSGNTAEALNAIQEAVAIRRRLAEASPARYEPGLALSLNNLSNLLADAGDGPGALEAIREAVAIHRRLAEANPAGYEPKLAPSLNNLSLRLADAGDGPGALEAIRDAVAIYRRLAQASPARYEPELAQSLNNLSIRLADSGDTAEALEAIREAVAIRRRLSEASPARYEPDLAVSLDNLSVDLADAGDGPGALEAIREAVAIRRRLAEASSARYEPELAASLHNLSLRLADAGDEAGALEAIREAVSLIEPYATATPGGPHARRYDAMQETLARFERVH